MKTNTRSTWLALSAFALTLCAAPAHAVVKSGTTATLSISDGDATPTSRSVLPGELFTITVSMLNTAATVTGVDYYLQSTGTGAGKFRITDRNIGTSKFSDVIRPDIGSVSFAGVEDTSVSLLNPRNGVDLGASIANVNSPLAANTKYDLASYVISVASNASPGTYVISTTSDTDTGWVAAMPFDEWSFNSHGTFTVTVNALAPGVPEPATGLTLLGMAAIFLRRRA